MSPNFKPEFTVVFEFGSDGWWTASIAEVPGVVSQGRTKDEAREMVVDALLEMLAYRKEKAIFGKALSTDYETLSAT